jgi:hypothetical protein
VRTIIESKKDKNGQTRKKLTMKQQREIEAAVVKAKGTDKPDTAQKSIPYRQIYPDGLCRVSENEYSRTIEFYDRGYEIEDEDEQKRTFACLCDLYNYFDSSVSVQFSYLNHRIGKADIQEISIASQGDGNDGIRREYGEVLTAQQKNGGASVKSKYLTFCIAADNRQSAAARLSKIEADILEHFRLIGAEARPLDGKERLKIFHDFLHPEDKPFSFSWNWLAKTGLSTKDHIAPSSLTFGKNRTFQMGSDICGVSILQVLAPELPDRVLTEFLSIPGHTAVNIHIKSLDQSEAIKIVKRKITDLDGMKIQEQKKAVRSGYDMDILPSDLATYGTEAKNLLNDLQSRNERLFMMTFLIMNTAESKQSLDNAIFQVSGIAQKNNCMLLRLDDQQEDGFRSSLPLGRNTVQVERALTTSAAAVFIPFISYELFQGGEALYYGLNKLTKNLIVSDRKKLKNPNGLILGVPGSGKSFAAKFEMIGAFLKTTDDIIICDPEGEYYPLVNRLGGQVIKIAQGSRHVVNPMDINESYSDDDNPLALKADFILSMCELILGGRNGLEPIEKTVIDRAVRNVYREYFNDPRPEKMPILENLYDELKVQPEREAVRIAAALEIYVHGSLNLFNHRTNVDIQNRLVCFDIKQLGSQLKKLGMLIIQDQVWNRVTKNRAEKKATRYYMDEFHLLLKEPQTAAYSVEIWKRFRKWGGIPTAITQNVKDLLASREVENIFENSDFVLMLSQAAGDRAILSQQLGISDEQMKHVTYSGAGEGLMFYGNVVIPFVNDFPKDSALYRLMTTKPSEAA